MKKIIPRKILFKKALPTAFVVAVLGFGLFLYDDNKDFISNFKLYHLKSYTVPASYVANNSNNDSYLALALGAFAINKNAIDYSVNQKLAKSVPVLLYHGVIENPDGSNILLEDFKNQMFALKKAGWQTIALEDFYDFMKGEKTLPDKSFLLTFDDGRKDSYYPADPILKALDYNAVIFVITKYSLEDKSGNYYLSKKELQRMTKSGRWEIEAHTRDGHNIYKITQDGEQGHYYSHKLWIDNENRLETEEEFTGRIKSDFAIAKSDIEQEIGEKVISFAFPFGDFGQNSENFPEAEPIILNTAKSIYSMAFYQIWPGKGFSLNYPEENPFLIKRIDVKPDWSSEALITLLDAGREKSLPYFENFEKYNGWIKTWGNLTLGNNLMTLGATDSNNGGSVFLDGSRLWKNYAFLAKIDWIKGRNVSLLARHKDDENYTACNFSDGEVHIEQRLNGKNRVMVEVKHNSNFPKNNLELAIRVSKDKVECSASGKIIAYAYYLSPALSSGGIGFKIWDPTQGNSELTVREVSVEEIKDK